MLSYLYLGGKTKYSLIQFDSGKKVYLTQEQDKEFNDWINSKFDKKAV